jgi:hypothetical protein
LSPEWEVITRTVCLVPSDILHGQTGPPLCPPVSPVSEGVYDTEPPQDALDIPHRWIGPLLRPVSEGFQDTEQPHDVLDIPHIQTGPILQPVSEGVQETHGSPSTSPRTTPANQPTLNVIAQHQVLPLVNHNNTPKTLVKRNSSIINQDYMEAKYQPRTSKNSDRTKFY